jgi:hypothetical protein
METELDIEVRRLLEARRGEWKRIAAEAGVSYSWISQFVRDLIPNPGYTTLRDLRAHLLRSAAAETSARQAEAGAEASTTERAA